MVNRPCKYLFYTTAAIIFFALSMPASAGQNGFNISVTQQTIELGKPAWLHISTRHKTPSLKTIDFSILQNAFEVLKDSEVNRSVKGQTWRIRLYPRQQGRLTIPVLHFSDHASNPMTLQVKPPRDPKTHRPFAIDYRVSNPRPWVKQQVLVTYRILSQDEHLVLKPQTAPDADLLLVPLSVATEKQSALFRHTTGWAIYPRKQGTHIIRLPGLHYVRDGVISHRFYPAGIKLDVKALPVYLPGNIPVGKLAFSPGQKPGFVLKERLQTLRLSLTGTGIPAQWLPDIRHFFKSQTRLTIYPVEAISQQTAQSGITSQHHYRIPFMVTAQGSVNLPSIRLHYFDPDIGKLKAIELTGHKTFAIAPLLLILLITLLAGASLITIIRFYQWLLPKWRCLHAYHSVLQSLPATHTPQQFKSLAAKLARGEGWPANLSLRQWPACLPQRHTRLAGQICRVLEPCLYRGGTCDPRRLQADFQHLCRTRWPILRWSGRY